MTVDELAEQFVQLSIAQNEADHAGRFRQINPLVDKRRLVQEELKRRPGDQRRAFVPLCEHPNSLVRANAAVAALALAPDVARRTLEQLAGARLFPASAQAYTALERLKSGAFVPE